MTPVHTPQFGRAINEVKYPEYSTLDKLRRYHILQTRFDWDIENVRVVEAPGRKKKDPRTKETNTVPGRKLMVPTFNINSDLKAAMNKVGVTNKEAKKSIKDEPVADIDLVLEALSISEQVDGLKKEIAGAEGLTTLPTDFVKTLQFGRAPLTDEQQTQLEKMEKLAIDDAREKKTTDLTDEEKGKINEQIVALKELVKLHADLVEPKEELTELTRHKVFLNLVWKGEKKLREKLRTLRLWPRLLTSTELRKAARGTDTVLTGLRLTYGDIYLNARKSVSKRTETAGAAGAEDEDDSGGRVTSLTKRKRGKGSATARSDPLALEKHSYENRMLLTRGYTVLKNFVKPWMVRTPILEGLNYFNPPSGIDKRVFAESPVRAVPTPDAFHSDYIVYLRHMMWHALRNEWKTFPAELLLPNVQLLVGGLVIPTKPAVGYGWHREVSGNNINLGDLVLEAFVNLDPHKPVELAVVPGSHTMTVKNSRQLFSTFEANKRREIVTVPPGAMVIYFGTLVRRDEFVAYPTAMRLYAGLRLTKGTRASFIPKNYFEKFQSLATPVGPPSTLVLPTGSRLSAWPHVSEFHASLEFNAQAEYEKFIAEKVPQQAKQAKSNSEKTPRGKRELPITWPAPNGDIFALPTPIPEEHRKAYGVQMVSEGPEGFFVPPVSNPVSTLSQASGVGPMDIVTFDPSSVAPPVPETAPSSTPFLALADV